MLPVAPPVCVRGSSLQGGGRGLFACDAFAAIAGAPLVKVSLRRSLTAARCRALAASARCPSLAACLSHVPSGSPPALVVIASLLFLRFWDPGNQIHQDIANDDQDDDLSFWRDYALNQLPHHLPSVLLRDPESRGMRLLEGTGVSDSVAAKLRRLKDEFEMLGDAFRAFDKTRDILFEDFVWADRCYWSRVLSFKSTRDGPPRSTDTERVEDEDEEEEHMVPFIDFANHSSTAKFRWEVVNAAGPSDSYIHICAIADVNVEQDEELCISYGDKSNATLLLLHNFTIPSNPHDTVIFSPPYMEDHPFPILDAKLRLLRSIHIVRPLVVLHRTPPHDAESPLLKGFFARAGEMLDLDSLLAATVALVSPEDEILPHLSNVDLDSIVATRESVMDALTTHALSDVLALRVWSVLQGLVELRIGELDAAEDDDSPSIAVSGAAGAADDGDEEEKLFLNNVMELRRGVRTVLEDAMKMFSSLVEEFYALETVQSYLQAMNSGNNEG